MKARRFKKKSNTVEAMQFVGNDPELWEIYRWVEDILPSGGVYVDPSSGLMVVVTPGGPVPCPQGHWLVKDEHDQVWVIPDHIFDIRYTEITYTGLDT